MLGNMRRILLLALLLANLCFAARPVIFDTDMGNDIDDALALAMLHALTDRGECQLIGVTLTNANPAAVPYVRMINRFYGRADLPVGAAIETLKGGAGDGYMAAALRGAATAEDKTAEPAPTRAAPPAARLRSKSDHRADRIQHQSGRSAELSGWRRARQGKGRAGGRHGG